MASICVAALACLHPGIAAAAACGPLQMINTVQMVRSHGGNRDMIPVQINGKDLPFLFDTGGVTTMISKKDATDLKLPVRQGNRVFYDATGNISREQASVAQFTLGHLHGKDLVFPVSPFGSNIFSLNFMLPYDVDVDFGNDRLNFFSQDHCSGGVLYWTAPAVAIVPLSVRDGHMSVPVTLDGKEFNALIDTGASTTTLRMDIAQRSYDLTMGTNDTPEAGFLNGDKDLKIYEHAFKTLSFGAIIVNNPHVTIIPDAMNRNGDMSQQIRNRAKLVRDNIVGPPILIGMNVLQHLHIYMAFGERKMYISPASPAQPMNDPAPATAEPGPAAAR